MTGFVSEAVSGESFPTTPDKCLFYQYVPVPFAGSGSMPSPVRPAPRRMPPLLARTADPLISWRFRARGQPRHAGNRVDAGRSASRSCPTFQKPLSSILVSPD